MAAAYGSAAAALTALLPKYGRHKLGVHRAWLNERYVDSEARGADRRQLIMPSTANFAAQ